MSDATPAPDVRPDAHEAASTPGAAPGWWRSAVIYQIYPRSWADADGDGIGDLPGITDRLPYLRDLGVDAIWLSPFYVSPQADAGYDVADYTDVDPRFGTLPDAEALVDRAHELDLRVIVDLVPNHTSDQHAWFQAALRSAPGSPERARYLFREGRGADGSEPPNNWRSVFGGPAWTRVTEADGSPGQWYLHLFAPEQPDLDWTHPEVHALFESVLRFWLDRGVDGFRVDVAHGLIKAEGLPDHASRTTMLGDTDDAAAADADPEPTHAAPMWDQDGVHEVYRAWRRVSDEYNPTGDPELERVFVAEAWVEPVERAMRYVRADEMHQTFNFDFLQAAWTAPAQRAVIEHSLAAAATVDAPTTWVLSNHDVVRHASRFGLPVGQPRPNGIGLNDPQPDAGLGLRRARAATSLMLALPGSAYLYQGEELGLPEHTTMPDDVRQDPTWERSEHTERGRDGCRVPMPWESDAPSFGFGPGTDPWLPQPDAYRLLAADQQVGVEGSTLELYRTLLRVRRERGLGSGALTWEDGYPDDVVALTVTSAPAAAGGNSLTTTVLANLGTEPIALPDGADVLLTSGDLTDDGHLPTDTTAWLA